jgi:mannose-6-phosphate isomerase
VDNSPTFDRRPWGTFQVLDEGDTYKVKRITVDPGHRLSYQLHHKRAEHWMVVAGRALVTLDDVDHDLAPGESIDIPRGARHRVRNPAPAGGDVLMFIEVQSGDYFGEDDIVRLDDDYGRDGSPRPGGGARTDRPSGG